MRSASLRWKWLLVVGFAFAPLATDLRAENQDVIYPGDTVTIIQPGVELGLKDKVAVVLDVGAKLRVTEVRGSWIGGYATVDNQRYTGWVNQDEVRLVVVSPQDVTTIEVPQKPDDAAAVSQLEGLGVHLEKNEQGNVHTADASESTLEDEHIPLLASLYQLSSLDLSNRPISDTGLLQLPPLSCLQSLYLDYCPITDKSLQHIGKFANLEIVSVRGTRVEGQKLAPLQSLKSLQTLNASNCQLGDAALAHVEKMPSLEVLALAGTEVTGSGLIHLKPLLRLRVLNLNGCRVNDDALPALYGLHELRMLYVEQTDVTEDGIEQFNNQTPELAIFD